MDEMLCIAAMLQVDSVFVKPSSGTEGLAARVTRRNQFEVGIFRIFNTYCTLHIELLISVIINFIIL